ncbi:MAG: prepilin-type N-terminal cleavage/methylation domain-containing protein [Ruminococcus sp.]|nr:prepilin-type N-terminal cleavage/methylation domain-containing protein [Ruminococcus sp.]
MKIKRKQKGFTLVELLIVLAVFSIILTLVMSFVDPVSKLMTKTSVRERTASYVDNIGDYIDKSVRYSKFIRVYKGDYGNRGDYAVISEKEAVQAFADDFFDNALADDGTPLKGKIHVLSLYNDNMPDSDDKPGVAYERTYTFRAGDSCPVQYTFYPDPTDTTGVVASERVFEKESVILKYDDEAENIHLVSDEIDCPTGSFPRAEIKEVDDSFHMILNPEHFTDYSYYYDYGFNQLEPITPNQLSDYTEIATDDELPTSENFYYSRIVKMKDGDGNDMSAEGYKFALNVIAYQNNAKGKNMIDAEYSTGVGSGISVPVFKSPSYMTTTSLSLRNCMATENEKDERYFKHVQNTFTGTETVVNKVDVDGKFMITEIDPLDYNGKTFEVIDTKDKNSAVDSNNIYIIYALPDEVSPSPIKYK